MPHLSWFGSYLRRKSAPKCTSIYRSIPLLGIFVYQSQNRKGCNSWPPSESRFMTYFNSQNHFGQVLRKIFFQKNRFFFLSPSPQTEKKNSEIFFRENWFSIRFRLFWVDLSEKNFLTFSREIFDFGSPWRPHRKSVQQILWDLALLNIDEHAYQVWQSVDTWCAR